MLLKKTLTKATILIYFVIAGIPLNSSPQEIIHVKRNVSDTLSTRNSSSKFEKSLYLVHYYDQFKEPHTLNWHLTSFQAKFKSDDITYMGFLNYGQVLNETAVPFNTYDMQYRIDAYPVFGENNYAYLSYAFSESEIFPHHQARGIFYHQFGKGFESSIGIYYMKWDETFTIYTGSLAKYYKNYWFSLRPYFQFEDGTLYQSYLVFARRYFSNPDDYLNLMIGYGSIPDNQAYLYNFENLYSLKSFNFQLNYNQSFNRWLFLIGAGLKIEEYQKDETRNHLRFEIGISYKL